MVRLTRATLIPIVLILLLALGVALLVGQKFLQYGKLKPEPTSKRASDWKTYNNSTYGFEVDYLSSWYFLEYHPAQNSDTEFWLLFSKEQFTVEGPTGHLWPEIHIVVLKTPHPDEELRRSGIGEGIVTPEGLRFDQVKYEPITIMRLPANRITTYSAPVIDFPHTELIFNYGGRGWKIVYPNLDYDGNYLPIYDTITSSFRTISQ